MSDKNKKGKDSFDEKKPVNEGDDFKTVVISQDEYEQLKSDALMAKEHQETMLRQQADLENVRKRLEKDKFEFMKYAHGDIVIDLLSILDDLERSVEAAEMKQENFEAFLKGIEMILSHLYEFLKKRGVTPIEARGKKFNPNEHEALMQTDTEEHKDGEVLEELQKGYKLNDKVIRTSKVRVAKKIVHE